MKDDVRRSPFTQGAIPMSDREYFLALAGIFFAAMIALASPAAAIPLLGTAFLICANAIVKAIKDQSNG
jgi:hypothetical protein